MRLVRVTATIIFLQGVAPLLAFGAWRAEGPYLLGVAGIFSLLAYGLWTARRWALPLGLLLILPQVVVVNSWLVSWRFFFGLSCGLGISPRTDFLLSRLSVYWQFGIGAVWRCFGYDPTVASTWGSEASTTFVCFNGIAFCLLVLLILSCRTQSPNHALQRTEAGPGAGSEFQP